MKKIFSVFTSLCFTLIAFSLTATSIPQLNKDSIEWNFSPEMRISLHQEWVINIPPEFSQRTLLYLEYFARKDPANNVRNTWDNNPAYLILKGFDSVKNKWILWKDQYGSEKYISFKPKPVKNIFHNINGYMENQSFQKIAIENTGQGDLLKSTALISRIILHFSPVYENNTHCKQFTPDSSLSDYKLNFVFNREKGKIIEQGERWRLLIPENKQTLHINSILIKHRKDPELFRGKDNWDDNPVYLSILAHDKNDNNLYPWYDRFSRDKFSEIRKSDDPETDNLHDCILSIGKRNIDFIDILSAGKGNPEFSKANIHEIIIVFFPDFVHTEKIQRVFTPDTEFVDFQNNIDSPVLMGGPRFKGKYPQSVMIGISSFFRMKKLQLLPEEHQFHTHSEVFSDLRGNFSIPLIPGRKLVSLELSIGDVDITTLETNKDGHFGRLGWSEIDVYLQKKDSEDQIKVYPFSTRENVPPAGVLWFFPDKGDYLVEKGDALVLHSRWDVGFLMGYRLLYKK